MIRYVVAAIVVVALVAVSVPAIETVGTMNTERQVDSGLAAIDEAATSLVGHEEVTPEGHPDPRRVVSVTLPAGSLTSTGVDHVELVPHGNETAEHTYARYVLEDGTTRTTVIDERIVWDDPDGNRTTELGGTGDQQLTLQLLADENGEPVVVAQQRIDARD